MPEPAQQDNRLKLADNPWYLQDMHSWRDERPLKAGDKNKKTKAPDPRLLNREDSEMFRLIMQMMGSGGYVDFMNELRDNRAKPGAPPPPVAPPVPTMTPTPTDDLAGGIDAINEKKKETLAEKKRRLGV